MAGRCPPPRYHCNPPPPHAPGERTARRAGTRRLPGRRPALASCRSTQRPPSPPFRPGLRRWRTRGRRSWRCGTRPESRPRFSPRTVGQARSFRRTEDASPPAAGSEARTCTAARVGNVLGFTATAATPAVPVVAAAPVPAQAERISGVYMSMLLTIGMRGGRLAYSEAVRRLTRVAVNKDAPMNLRDLCVAVWVWVWVCGCAMGTTDVGSAWGVYRACCLLGTVLLRIKGLSKDEPDAWSPAVVPAPPALDASDRYLKRVAAVIRSAHDISPEVAAAATAHSDPAEFSAAAAVAMDAVSQDSASE